MACTDRSDTSATSRVPHWRPGARPALQRQSLLAQGLLSNKPLLGAVAPLGPADLTLALGLSSIVFFAVETEKWLRRRLTSSRPPSSPRSPSAR